MLIGKNFSVLFMSTPKANTPKKQASFGWGKKTLDAATDAVDVFTKRAQKEGNRLIMPDRLPFPKKGGALDYQTPARREWLESLPTRD